MIRVYTFTATTAPQITRIRLANSRRLYLDLLICPHSRLPDHVTRGMCCRPLQGGVTYHLSAEHCFVLATASNGQQTYYSGQPGGRTATCAEALVGFSGPYGTGQELYLRGSACTNWETNRALVQGQSLTASRALQTGSIPPIAMLFGPRMPKFQYLCVRANR